MKKIILLTCISILVQSCNGQRSVNFCDAKYIVNIDTLNTNMKLYFTDLFNSYSIIPLETSANNLIGKIDEIEFHNDTMIILDRNISKSISLYDENGKYIRKIGKLGKGSGEYVKPISICVNHKEKSIIILCESLKKVIYYTMQGQFLNEFRINTTGYLNSIACYDDKVFIDVYPDKGRTDNFLLYSYNKSGEEENRHISNKLYRNGFTQLFSLSNVFSNSTSGVKYCKPFMSTVFEIKSNEALPYLYLCTENIASDNQIKEFNTGSAMEFVSNAYRKTKVFTGISNYIESDSIIYLKFGNKGRNNNLLLSKENRQTYLYNGLVDNLTDIKFPSFTSVYKNSFISVVEAWEMENFIANIRGGKISTTNTNIDLAKININSNPVIIIYK